MPTLEEELEALKSALSLLQTRHISDVKQLSEQILLLQQQIDDQKKRSLQFPAISQGFSILGQKIDQLTIDIKQKFDASDHFAARTWGRSHDGVQAKRKKLAAPSSRSLHAIPRRSVVVVASWFPKVSQSDGTLVLSVGPSWTGTRMPQG